MTVTGAEAPDGARALERAARAAAVALHRAARGHKAAAAAHRRSAQESMRALETFRAECARLGIRVDVVTAQEAQTDDHPRRGR